MFDQGGVLLPAGIEPLPEVQDFVWWVEVAGAQCCAPVSFALCEPLSVLFKSYIHKHFQNTLGKFSQICVAKLNTPIVNSCTMSCNGQETSSSNRSRWLVRSHPFDCSFPQIRIYFFCSFCFLYIDQSIRARTPSQAATRWVLVGENSTLK